MPAPLDYFAAGAAFCLASHLTLLINQNKMNVRGFEFGANRGSVTPLT